MSLSIHRQGWVANHDGNVSMRTAQGFVITPTAMSKRLCAQDTIVDCDPSGKPRSAGRPPSEVALHVAAYSTRPDVNAVIHAHPPNVSAFALVGRELSPIAMPEVVVSLGAAIPTVPRFLPKDPAAGPALTEALRYADVALMTGNGAITVGPDLETAFLRMELVEHYARILAIASGGLGQVSPLSDAEIDRLLKMRKKAGLLRGPAPDKKPAVVASTVRAVVAEEVRRVLGGGEG